MSLLTSLRRNYEQGRISGTLLLGLGILLAIVLFSIIGPMFVDAVNAQVGAVRPRKPPGPEYFLGTDSQGRDMWTLLIYATPNTLKMGLIAGHFGGIIDAIIRVISDALLTVPAIAILVIIAGNIDRMNTVIMALVVASLGWMFTTRTVRAQVLTIREKSYVEVARVNGESQWEILFTEIMPNLMPYIVASFVGTVSGSILAVIGLEALGLGALDEMTLGNTIYWSQQSSAVLRGYWWWWGPPIVVIAAIFIGLFLTSVGFDRFANPKLARR